jgi:cysteinyl-tRNA synthetase
MLQLHNTLTGAKAPFSPLNPEHITMYVCGPTVYARPHIGNARSVVVYDVLYRLLQTLYPRVTYARNITDVDDKIIVASREKSIAIQALTSEVTAQFHADMEALNCLSPTIEPRATEHIDGMVEMIHRLIDRGHAYVGADGEHVLFDVTSHPDYGHLSGRKLDDLQAGARVAVESYKHNAGDFVLWKPADDEDDESAKFDSPWGLGRPGWHIECSVMATHYLGETFDIHGGGADLKFPHHENEIAQSCCANEGSAFAKTWVHNGFLTVNGEKMSKSLGNFITVHDLLEQGVKGEVIRLALMMSKYNEPLDWNSGKVAEAETLLDKWYRLSAEIPTESESDDHTSEATDDSLVGLVTVYNALFDDLNFPKALSELQKLEGKELILGAQFLGLLQQSAEQWFKGDSDDGDAAIQALIDARAAAKKAKDYAESDRIRDELKAQGIILEDRPDGTTDWRRG